MCVSVDEHIKPEDLCYHSLGAIHLYWVRLTNWPWTHWVNMFCWPGMPDICLFLCLLNAGVTNMHHYACLALLSPPLPHLFPSPPPSSPLPSLPFLSPSPPFLSLFPPHSLFNIGPGNWTLFLMPIRIALYPGTCLLSPDLQLRKKGENLYTFSFKVEFWSYDKLHSVFLLSSWKISLFSTEL